MSDNILRIVVTLMGILFFIPSFKILQMGVEDARCMKIWGHWEETRLEGWLIISMGIFLLIIACDLIWVGLF